MLPAPESAVNSTPFARPQCTPARIMRILASSTVTMGAMPRTTPDACELCQAPRELTFHHLIPRKVHRRTFFKRNYDRDTLQAGVHLCRLCHSAVHRFFDEMTLAKQYASLEALRAAPELQRHASWARKQR